MEKTVAQMTPYELRTLVGDLLEEKLLELLGKPDEGLLLRESLQLRLEEQNRRVAAGERGQPFEDVVTKLGLA